MNKLKNKGCKIKQKSFGFTLAEVLITLGIIGIVAAMTMPTLIQKNQEKETVVKLKKFNTIINQAYMSAISDNGDVEGWGLNKAGMTDLTEEEEAKGEIARDVFWDKLAPYLKVNSRCRWDNSTCLQYDRYSLDGMQFWYFVPRLTLADGTTIVATTIIDLECSAIYGTSKLLKNVCGEMMVDLNGPKQPNATGKDVFVFIYTKYGIVPDGMPDTFEGKVTFEKYCNLSKPNKINGYGCAAWVIYNENMDYLHCNNLSWDGKHKCK